MQLATQGESMQPPLLAKEECDSWWATEDDKNAWMEFQQVNETLNFEYMRKNEPFDELPWQYFPKPKIGHYPPAFIYGFPLGDGVSGIEHLARATGILKPEEVLTPRGLDSILARTLKHLEEECGLLREEFLSVDGCYSKAASYVLMLKTSYNLGHVAPKKLEHVIKVIRRYLPGRTPQWFLDPDIIDMGRRNFEIPVEALLSL